MTDTARFATALADRYRIEREVGSGGMATVYLARDLKHDREVAVKVLRSELGAVLGTGRFLAEIKITARLDHPHILTLIDSGAAEGFLYYVVPYVRGESLRQRLDREKQLGVDEALAITKQIVGALDYAHRQGVVHRDIKPENILIQEGEAMLTDFGIALAVREAGGNRLTETGLSLGTPQYMSPEQATGDRQLDARSDIYSLAAVLFEMLAGEPPITGPTVQALIAKLMTERPLRLRSVRDTVPDGIDAAVAKALAKVPADRFASAGDFGRALDVRLEAAAPTRGRGRVVAMAVGAVAVVALSAAAVCARGSRARDTGFALRDRTQLTFSGAVVAPAISPDGKQLAYFTRTCAETKCDFSVDVQDVGGTTTHRLLVGATDAFGIDWSPDRRNLILTAAIDGRYGSFLLSTLGGRPRHMGSAVGDVAFFAGGDSLLLGPPFRPDSAPWVQVASLDGTVKDSFPVAVAGLSQVNRIMGIPDTRWIVIGVGKPDHSVWQVTDRRGIVADRLSCDCFVEAASNTALWFGFPNALVRVPVDSKTGHLAARRDTVFSGAYSGVTTTADGGMLVTTEGTLEYSAWALDLADALAGRFPERRRLFRESKPFSIAISPDGSRLLVGRELPPSSGQHLSTMPFDGGDETPVHGLGPVDGWGWIDSVTLEVQTSTPRGGHLALVDIRSGVQRNPLDLSDSITGNWQALPDGWAWIPRAGDRVILQRGTRRREVPLPPWFAFLQNVNVDPAGKRLVLIGPRAVTLDSVGAAVVPIDGGAPVMWAAEFGVRGTADFLPDGSLLFGAWKARSYYTLYHVKGPGHVTLLGTVPRPIDDLGPSDDLRRAAVVTRDRHADAWMSKVVRR